MANHPIFPPKRGLQSENLLPPPRRRCVRLSPIAQYSSLLPPRRSLARISVPVWLIVLSDQLPVVALVGRYPTNKLIGHEPIFECHIHDAAFLPYPRDRKRNGVLASLSAGYPPLKGRLPMYYSPVRHFTTPKSLSFDLHVLGAPPAFVLKPGSNSQKMLLQFTRATTSTHFFFAVFLAI